MTERLLQFIWQFQYFNRRELCTDDGAALDIVQSGKYNRHQGPDFLEAGIRIDNTQLFGHIEIHIKSSDWNRHGHQSDPNYNNVILHVVWQHDAGQNGPSVPVLILQHRVPVLLLNQYNEWMEQVQAVPCAAIAKDAGDLVWTAWKERLLLERLLRKNKHIVQLLHNNQAYWEETCWQLLARNFGTPVNAEAFENMARTLPLAILLRHRHQLTVVEALLLGQAGLLQGDYTDDYARLLQREYSFHRRKYKLPAPPHAAWFLRMRPAAFPTIRLAQLAALLTKSTHLFTSIREVTSRRHLTDLLNVSANDYWHYHYRFDEPAAYKIKNLGRTMIDNIVINTIAPLLFAYGSYHHEQWVKDRALQWLSETRPEKNSITESWQALGITHQSADQSQALIELKTQYCDQKKCLDCAIGNALLKKKS